MTMVTGGGAAAAAAAGTGALAPSTTTAVPPPETAAGLPPRRTNENRRSNKPIMEKRRRARINNCLNELKTLILDAMKKDPARHSKLEKADILEMTVKHLENLQRQQAAMSAATDPNILNKFRAGFSECAGEVGRFPGLESPVRRRLLQHLANCLNGTAGSTASESSTTTTQQHTVQVHILPTPSTAGATIVEGHPVPTAIATSQNGIFLSTAGTGGGLQLVPTRLPNGDIALVLPSSGTGTSHVLRQTIVASPVSSPAPSTNSTSSSPLPMLIPIPSRTSSTSSAASSSSSSSCVSASTEGFERLAVSTPPTAPVPVCRDVATSPASYQPPLSPSHHSNSSSSSYDVLDRPYSPPLSLVVRKTDPPEEEKPWRPW